jgi:hypothetical protein
MTTTLLTYQIPKLEKSYTGFVKTRSPSNSQKMKAELTRVVAKLERQDIGWLDILSAMANIAEQQGDDQVAEVLEAGACVLKRNRKVIRNL